MLGVGVVGGVSFSIQFEGRADGAKRNLHRCSADSTPSSVSSSTDFRSKGAEELNLFDVGEGPEMGVQLIVPHEGCQMVPIVLPFVVSRIHDPIGDGFIRSSEKTSELSLSASRNSFQDAFCVRAKSELNFCKKEKSVSSYVSFPAFLNDLLAKSAMRFRIPAIVSGASGEDSVAQWRRARARTRRCPTLDFLDVSLSAQETVDLLSIQDAVCWCRRSTSCSRASR